MQFIIVFLINGFLLSITPSTVTDSECINKTTVVEDKCDDNKPAPLVLPQPQNGTTDIDEDTLEHKITMPSCPEGKVC